MAVVRSVLLSRAGIVLLLIGLVVAVGLATGTIRTSDRAGRSQATTARRVPSGAESPRSYTQIDSYSHGYSCVKLTLSAFAKARLTANIRTVAGRRRMTKRVVHTCDSGATEDGVTHIAWYRMGASDAMRDGFGEPSARDACLENFGCGATHATIRYFEFIGQGLMKP